MRDEVCVRRIEHVRQRQEDVVTLTQDQARREGRRLSRRGARPVSRRTISEGRQGYCHSCNKMSFDSRKSARANARRNFPNEQLNAFRCYVDGKVWHYGHLKDGDR